MTCWAAARDRSDAPGPGPRPLNTDRMFGRAPVTHRLAHSTSTGTVTARLCHSGRSFLILTLGVFLCKTRGQSLPITDGVSGGQRRLSTGENVEISPSPSVKDCRLLFCTELLLRTPAPCSSVKGGIL